MIKCINIFFMHFFKYYFVCPKCGKSIDFDKEGIVEKGCCYTREIREIIIEMSSKEHISYGKVAELINDNRVID